jgi:hypothetical protein
VRTGVPQRLVFSSLVTSVTAVLVVFFVAQTLTIRQSTNHQNLLDCRTSERIDTTNATRLPMHKAWYGRDGDVHCAGKRSQRHAQGTRIATPWSWMS